MAPDLFNPDDEKHTLKEIIGYLNFSSGAKDPQFLGGLNHLFELIGLRSQQGTLPVDDGPKWQIVGQMILWGLESLRQQSATFEQADQAEAVTRLVFEHFLPAYLEFHRDLLFHQSEETLFLPFFIGRACEAVLTEGGPWDQTDRIVHGAMKRLNDFIGYRPVPVLRTQQKLQPYDHEWVRPIPLYIEGVGVSNGPYRDLVEQAMGILRQTPPELLRQAWFNLDLLAELALDPRAYDFDHPVNRRPNYHFGGWDPHCIDNKGYYRRFVLRQVTLDSLLERIESTEGPSREEYFFEAATVLAGTMLMGSGVTGNGPDAHDSQTTLATLLPVIAGYRDAFYEEPGLLASISRQHCTRLKKEAKTLRQPLGGARHDLNRKLARRRADQLQREHLARLFAQMGYIDAAMDQAGHVPVASVRIRCEIDCRLSTAHLNIDQNRAAESPHSEIKSLLEIEERLHRAIECGALIDPWSILGFGGQFSLFPAMENSIQDHRVDELIDLMEDLFGLYARLLKEAAITSQTELRRELSAGMQRVAQWWDQFASTEVSGVGGFSGEQAWKSAEQVATALATWRESAAAAAGDIGFWSEHIQRFQSPKAFTLLVESLLDNRDMVASMALLTYWLGRANEVPLAESDYAFYGLAIRWMEDLWWTEAPESEDVNPTSPGVDQASSSEHCWALSRKFLDYLEANADEYWEVPKLDLPGYSAGTESDVYEEEGAAQEDEDDDLFSAAYENVSYRDTTDDGFEGELAEGADLGGTDFELAAETERISDRLAMLATVARLWKLAAELSADAGVATDNRRQTLEAWRSQVLENRRQLLNLLGAIHHYRIAEPDGTHESLVEYSRRQGIKEALSERVVMTYVEMSDTARYFLVATGDDPPRVKFDPWEVPAERVLQAAQEEDIQAVREAWPDLLRALRKQPLLYVPPSRGGSPLRMAGSRSLVRMLGRLLTCASRLGLLSETYHLLTTIQQMEKSHPAGPGGVTEFDRLFEIGCKGIVQCLISSSDKWPRATDSGQVEDDLMNYLQTTVERLMVRWLAHSRNIRLSVLEMLGGERHWKTLVAFIKRYGHDLFTQYFMNYGNLRAILHQGAGTYLDWLCEQPGAKDEVRLAAECDATISHDEAAAHLEVIIEAIVENYSEYIDYNSTTTQSDRGELLYMLLDFLRLEASYNRTAWNLKPVVIAHQVLVRNQRDKVAEMWREAVARRSDSVADDHLAKLDNLSRKYGMRLPSVFDRLGERFVRPLVVDRLCALVAPAMEEVRATGPKKWFARLEQLVAEFTAEPSGVGFEVPAWLEALQREVHRVRFPETDEDEPLEPPFALPQVCLTRDQIERQVNSWNSK